MSPVLSTFSGASARAFGFGYNFASSDFEHIETQTVGAGGSTSITFSSIAGTYKHLQIRAVTRGTAAVTDQTNWLRPNNSTSTSDYAWHQLAGDGANASSYGVSGTNYLAVGQNPGSSQTANIFGAMVIDILDYASTSKNKTIRSLMGADYNGSGQVMLRSGLYIQTTAITSLVLLTATGNWAQYSSFSLYGVK